MAISRAKGTRLFIEQDDHTYDVVPSCTELKFPERTWAVQDTTSHDSQDRAKTFAPTLRDDGALQLTLTSYDPLIDTHAQLRDLVKSVVETNFKITFPSGSGIGSFSFSGYVTKFVIDGSPSSLQTATFTILANGTVGDVTASITSVAVTDGQAGAYITGEAMTLKASFDELVTVTGSPRIPIVLTSGTVYATYSAGSGTNELTFSKTFGGGDAAEATHVSIGSPMQLNGGTIKDFAGQAAIITFSPPNTSTYSVN